MAPALHRVGTRLRWRIAEQRIGPSCTHSLSLLFYAMLGVHPVAVRLVQATLGGVLLPWGAYRLAGVLFAD